MFNRLSTLGARAVGFARRHFDTALYASWVGLGAALAMVNDKRLPESLYAPLFIASAVVGGIKMVRHNPKAGQQ